MVEVPDALRTRRMVRSFASTPVDRALTMRLATDALRAPTAGNARGVSLVVLDDPSLLETYWDLATDADWRATSSRFPGLSRAPVAVLLFSHPAAYLERYQAEDKANSGLGQDAAVWPVPYWHGDAGASAFALLLGATSAALGACFLGAFRGRDAVTARFAGEATASWFGTVLLGHPDGMDHRSRSLDRPSPARPRLVVNPAADA